MKYFLLLKEGEKKNKMGNKKRERQQHRFPF